MNSLGALQAVSAVLVPIILSALTVWGSQRASKRQAEASPYEAMAKRLVELEKKDDDRDKELETLKDELSTLKDHVRDLKSNQGTDRAYIRRLHAWLEKEGLCPPFSAPGWLNVGE